MFSSLGRRRVFLLVILTCVLLISLDSRGNAVLDKARGVVSLVLRPFDTAVRAVALPVERAWNGVSNYDKLQRETEALRDQIERMKGNDLEAQSAILEYRELLKLIQLNSKFQLATVAAQVVGASPSNFEGTVEINVGSLRGVAVGMPVTNGAGLIGRITRVYPDRSLVLLMTDPKFAISAQLLSTQTPEPPATSSPPATTPSGLPVDNLTTTLAPTTLPPDATGAQPDSTPAASSPSTTTTTTLPPIEVVRETGTLEGQGQGRPLVLRFVDSASPNSGVKVGAIVDTAGGNNSLAPQGIPIGTISRIVDRSGATSAIVEVTPNASLDRLFFVSVVLYKPNDAAVGH